MPSYRDLCNEILQLDSVSFVGVITMDGKILFSDYKKSKPLYKKSEAESVLMKAAIRMGSRKEFLERLGGVNYSLTEYSLAKQFTIPLEKDIRTLLFVSEYNGSNGSNDKITIDSIMEILMKHGLR